MNKRLLGEEKETMVCEFLKKHGYHILERNYRNRYGEIDIIAKEQDYLVFIEVKYRKGTGLTYAKEAVNKKKQQQISKVALFYITKEQIFSEYPMRFDVVALDDYHISVIKNAFSYCYSK